MKDEKQKRRCLLDGCEVEFIPKNTKTRFCSAKHRVMWHRKQEKKTIPPKKETPKKDSKKSTETKDTQMPSGLDRISQMRWLRENP